MRKKYRSCPAHGVIFIAHIIMWCILMLWIFAGRASAWLQTIICLCGLAEGRVSHANGLLRHQTESAEDPCRTGSPGDAQVVLAGKGGDRPPLFIFDSVTSCVFFFLAACCRRRPRGALAVTRDIERRVVQARLAGTCTWPYGSTPPLFRLEAIRWVS